MHSMDVQAEKLPSRLLVVCVLFVALWGCSKPKKQVEQGGLELVGSSVQTLLPAAYTDTTLDFPKLRFTNAAESLNDRCPVRKAKLNTKLTPLFVNGRPLGFC